MSNIMVTKAPVSLVCELDYIICQACGTQYPIIDISSKLECKICEDPRQFVPPGGQAWTTLRALQRNHRNKWWTNKRSPRIHSVRTTPDFAISNRAILIQTARGNILWDLIPFLDEETVNHINYLGGLHAIIISHPHYYSTWADWSRTFRCPVYVGAPDREWFERRGTPGTDVKFLTDTATNIRIGNSDVGLTALLAGGHFPGSLLLHWQNVLFIADTIFTSPSALNPVPGKPGVISFNFFWSIPNRIPLHPDAVHRIWEVVKDYTFYTAFGAFEDQDIYTQQNEGERGTGGVKGRLLESCKLFVKAEGHSEHKVFAETWP